MLAPSSQRSRLSPRRAGLGWLASIKCAVEGCGAEDTFGFESPLTRDRVAAHDAPTVVLGRIDHNDADDNDAAAGGAACGAGFLQAFERNAATVSMLNMIAGNR